MATSLYDTDFVAWTREQAAELRRLRDARINTRLDLDQLAEEVEDLGSERKIACESFVELIIEHLLKLAHSPALEPRKKWMVSIHNARRSAARRMTATIRREIEASLDQRFEAARAAAHFAMRLHGEAEAMDALPSLNPYRLDEILDPDFWPPEPQARP